MTELSMEISNAIVALTRDYTGRGPMRARSYIHENLIVCVLHDQLTRGEQRLVESGREEEVLLIRRTYQEAMREDMIACIEQLTGRTVLAFLSANTVKPDVAIESFTLELRNGLHEDEHDTKD